MSGETPQNRDPVNRAVRELLGDTDAGITDAFVIEELKSYFRAASASAALVRGIYAVTKPDVRHQADYTRGLLDGLQYLPREDV